jgi:hypothetical protein
MGRPAKYGATIMTTNEQALRVIFRNMNADDAQRIREAYYKASEGLRALADTLELADARMPAPGNELLIGEHLLACDALTTMKKSELGRVL